MQGTSVPVSSSGDQPIRSKQLNPDYQPTQHHNVKGVSGKSPERSTLVEKTELLLKGLVVDKIFNMIM